MSDPVLPQRKKGRTVTEYRVLSCRGEGWVTEKRLRSLKAVERRINILTADEPWRFFSDARVRLKGPDDLVCCPGRPQDECGCGGLTMAEDTAQKRKDLPPLQWIRVEARTITTTPWVNTDTASYDWKAKEEVDG